MSPPLVRERKRIRTTTLPTLLDEDDTHHSNEDTPRQYSDDPAARPCQAERKRELERNRRNLVNIRFVQLEKELRRSAPRLDSSTPLNDPAQSDIPLPGKGKRIDKEAVLKDAASRLAVQRRDLEVASERITSMSTEIDNLRAEKVELRSDKAYLRSEVDTVRKEVQRLREDNINLWQAFRKASTLKDSLGSDIAKIPAELFMRSPNPSSDHYASMLPTPSTMPHQTTPLPISQLLPAQGSSRVPHRPQGLSQPQSSSPQNQQSDVLPNHPHQPTTPQTSKGLQNASQNVYTSQPQSAASPTANDSYLMYASPDEIGDLFTNFVPAPVQNFTSKNQNNNPPQQPETNSTSGNPLAATSAAARPEDYFASSSSQRPPSGVRQMHASESKEPPTKAESEDADPFSDVAYCV